MQYDYNSIFIKLNISKIDLMTLKATYEVRER